jgi:hypothetical protein
MPVLLVDSHAWPTKVLLLQGSEGIGNLDRFAASWKPVEKASAALEDMRGFGHPLHGKPGSKPLKV